MNALEHARRIDDARRRLAAKLPDIDAQDLVLILDSLFRPFGSGRKFLLRRTPRGYVF